MWAATGVELGRVYLRHLRKPGTSVSRDLKTRAARDRFCIPISHFKEAIAELQWWLQALEARAGSFHWHLIQNGAYEKWRWTGEVGGKLPAGVVDFATDACPKGGGGVYEFDRVVRMWDQDEQKHPINVLECFMVLHMCLLYGAQWVGLRVVAWCDNLVSVKVINKGSGVSSLMTSIVRRIRLICLEYGFELWVCHIPGAINFDADALSRGTLGTRIASWSFIAQCRARWNQAAGGSYTIDAFADVSGRNSRGTRFCSSQDSPMGRTFEGERVWAFPPPLLVEEFLMEESKWKAQLVVLVLSDHLVKQLSGRWEVLHRYPSDARVFERSVGGYWVKCSSSGLALTVVRWS